MAPLPVTLNDLKVTSDTIRYDIFACAQKLTKWPA